MYFGFAAFVGDMNDAAGRFRQNPPLDGVNLAVGPAHVPRGDKISGFDVTETILLEAINLRIR